MEMGLMLMAGLVLASIIGAIVFIAGKNKEKFSKELIDITAMKRTMAVEDSSYSQRTNHMEPAAYSSGPLPGTETPFQVNQFKAYVT
jgi:uncharacterized protein (UPF0333 family)